MTLGAYGIADNGTEMFIGVGMQGTDPVGGVWPTGGVARNPSPGNRFYSVLGAVQNQTGVHWRDVAFGANAAGTTMWVAVATGKAMYSTDGLNWSAGTGAAGADWSRIAAGNGMFVAIAGSGSGKRAMYSTDGANWTASTTVPTEEWSGVTYGNGKFVAVGKTGAERIMYTLDGITWVGEVAPAQQKWAAVEYGPQLGMFVAWSDTDLVNYPNTSLSMYCYA